MKLLICILSTLVVFSQAQLIPLPFHISMGGCDANAVKNDFDFFKIIGKWYQIEGSTEFTTDMVAKCRTLEFYAPPLNATAVNTNAITVIRKYTNTTSNVQTTNTGFLKLNQDPAKASLFALFFDEIYLTGFYEILATDYLNYMVMQRCNNFGLAKQRMAWIFTRARYPTPITMGLAYAVLVDNDINKITEFASIDQLTCPSSH